MSTNPYEPPQAPAGAPKAPDYTPLKWAPLVVLIVLVVLAMLCLIPPALLSPL